MCGFSTDVLIEVAKISILHFSFSISNLEAGYIQNTRSSKTRFGVPVLGLNKQRVRKWRERFYAQYIFLQIMASGRCIGLNSATEHSYFDRQLVRSLPEYRIGTFWEKFSCVYTV